MVEDVSPLLQAAYRRDWDTVADVQSRDGVTDVFEAAVVGDVNALERFLAADAAAVRARSHDGFTALHLAAYFGRENAIPILLHAGADADSVANNGTSLRPLHAATAARCPTIVGALLEAGADPAATQEGGFTPLMAAAKHGDEDSIRLLLARGADPLQAAVDGRTAVELAAPEVADLLANTVS